MAFDYGEITEAETNPGAPGRSSLWKRWWKNPIAMFQGALGAPRLQFEAVDAWLVTAGAIGSLAFLGQTSTASAIVAGTVYAGSGLRYAGFDIAGGLEIGGATPAGSWRALGSNAYLSSSGRRATLFIRIA